MIQYSIEQSIWNNAKKNPDKIALKSGKEAVSYRDLCSNILAAKNFFENLPFYSKGSTIIIAAGKQLSFAYAYFGAHLADIKVIPIDAETNQTRFQHIVDVTSPICVIGFDKIDTSITKFSLRDFDKLNGIDNLEYNNFPTLSEIADILFTTGTTGTPKGVPLTFENESAAARNINTFIKNTEDDIELLALPISHSFGLGRMRCCLSKGATLILLGSFVNVKRIFSIIETEKVTGFTMVPASWKFLQKMSGNQLSNYANQLKYIEMGSAYFSADDKKELANLFPNTRVTMHYGLTEASRSTFMEFHNDDSHLNSVGKASPYTDIKIFDEQGNILPENVEGEICIKGEHVTKGYLNTSPESFFWNEYFRTGDWGLMDKDGYVYLKSRKKELINVGGKKVSPLEVEDQLLLFQGIEDCACIAIPDPNGVLGEVVKAYIVKSAGADFTFEELTKFLSGKLESYKIPVSYEWIKEIPRTQNGKIQRNLL
ncbi:class I adenylate-forming enzyme family protein [uncultured Bacteroides sp.]|uniref:class I adenylate-forming enzyme family protein n=1 Tax=uncultured Bacteroides sp. TaxID=162156 RepID=UPI00261FB0F4|nr:class I adenylate-forming enzyme family protein [uncultured Bacteroides sp.]